MVHPEVKQLHKAVQRLARVVVLQMLARLTREIVRLRNLQLAVAEVQGTTTTTTPRTIIRAVLALVGSVTIQP